MKSEEVLRRICVRRREACLSCVTGAANDGGLAKTAQRDRENNPSVTAAPRSLLRTPKPPLCKGRWLRQRRSRKGCPSAARFPGMSPYPAAPQIRDSLPCARGGGSAKGGDERVARRQPVFRECPSTRQHRKSGTAIPQSRCRSTAPFTQGSLIGAACIIPPSGFPKGGIPFISFNPCSRR